MAVGPCSQHCGDPPLHLGINMEVEFTPCLVFRKWSSKGPCHPLPCSFQEMICMPKLPRNTNRTTMNNLYELSSTSSPTIFVGKDNAACAACFWEPSGNIPGSQPGNVIKMASLLHCNNPPKRSLSSAHAWHVWHEFAQGVLPPECPQSYLVFLDACSLINTQ